MKKLVFVLSLMIFGSMGLSAQQAKTAKSCSGKKTACCASKAKAAGTADTKVLSMAESLAASDENITKRVCADSGSTSFYKKEVCSTSGKISYNEVEFDATNNQFVNKSPNDIGDANQGKLIKVVNKETAPAMAKAKPSKEVKKSCAKTCTKAEMKKCATKVQSTEENN